MPGPGHNHSERFEACLSHLKSQGADDGKAHRVCYTSVGKAMYGLENNCACSDMEQPGHREHGPVGRDFITLEDLSLGCMYCKELIEMDEYYKTKYGGDEEPGTRPYREVPGTRQSADGVYKTPAEKLFVDRANEHKMAKGPMSYGGLAQTPEANAATIGRKSDDPYGDKTRQQEPSTIREPLPRTGMEHARRARIRPEDIKGDYNLTDDPNAFQPHTDPQKDAGSVSSATPNAVNPVYRQKSLEDRVADLEECAKSMKSMMSKSEEKYDFELNIPILPIFIDLAKADGQRKIAGWASVEIVDRHGELITMDSFDEKTIANFMTRTGGRIHLQHQDVPIGIVTNIERKKMPDGTPGLWVEAELMNLGETIDDAVWNGVLRGKISGFSIKGRAMERETRCNADLCYAYIPEIELYGISAVEKPANQASAISAVVDDKGHNIKLSDKSNNTILTGINMSKSLSKAEKPPMKPVKKEGEDKKVPPGNPKDEGQAKPASQHGKVSEVEEPGESPQDGSDKDGDQMVEKPETPDTGMGMEERFKKAESAIAGLTEAMRKLAPGTQEAARTAAAMAEGLSRKSDEEEDEDMKKDEAEAGEVEAEAEEEVEAEAEGEAEVEAKKEAGPFDVPHTEPSGGIPGHQPPDFGMKKEIPAGGQYVEHPNSPSGTIAEQLASVQKELAELKKQFGAQKKLPVSNSRAAPIIQKTNTTTKIGRTDVPSDVAKAIDERLKGNTNDQSFMMKAFKIRYE